MNKISLSLILPIHNQEDITASVVSEIVKDLNKNKILFEILLVENGSTDNTYTVVKKLDKNNSHIRALTAKKGYGSAIIKGLHSAKGEYVCYMPSDGQLDSKLVAKLYKIITKESYDLVKIKRISRESILRSIRSKGFNILTKLLFRIPVEDINGSPRIFLRNWLPILKIQFKDSFIDTEMAIKAYYLRWEIKEVPAITFPRKGGKSTVSIKTVIEFIENLFRYKISNKLKTWINSST